jgi:hypothetical protein
MSPFLVGALLNQGKVTGFFMEWQTEMQKTLFSMMNSSTLGGKLFDV